jgi:hypothetical protein
MKQPQTTETTRLLVDTALGGATTALIAVAALAVQATLGDTPPEDPATGYLEITLFHLQKAAQFSSIATTAQREAPTEGEIT